MINKLKYATILDIGVTNLFFFDSENEKKCSEFCRNNLISYLPAKDKKSVYKFDNPGFTNLNLEIEFCINPFDRIFDNSTLKKFEKVNHNEIRFITDKSKIKGVVHIIDYNNENIQVEFYRAFYRFENNIRNLLIISGYKNEDFIKWAKTKSELEENGEDNIFWINRYKSLMPIDKKNQDQEKEKRSSSNPFQTFYMRELLLFCLDQNLINQRFIKFDSVCSLRNSIAHNKDFTSKINESEGSLVYDFKNLKAFIAKANDFFDSYEYLEEKVKSKYEVQAN